MEINITNKHGLTITYEAENVKVEEDIEERIYHKTVDGKNDYSMPAHRDISDEILTQFADILDELVTERERKFDSSILIERLFGKLPQESINNLLVRLNKDYGIE